MIKLHYSLVDILDACIQRLDEDGKQRRRRVRPRTQIMIPETRNRATIVIAESRHFAAEALSPSLVTHVAETFQDDKGSISNEPGGFEFDDEDVYE